MSRDEALRLIELGLLSAHACRPEKAPEQAEELLDAYLRDPVYTVEGVEVPVEMVTGVLESL